MSNIDVKLKDKDGNYLYPLVHQDVDGNKLTLKNIDLKPQVTGAWNKFSQTNSILTLSNYGPITEISGKLVLDGSTTAHKGVVFSSLTINLNDLPKPIFDNAIFSGYVKDDNDYIIFNVSFEKYSSTSYKLNIIFNEEIGSIANRSEFYFSFNYIKRK